MNDREKVIRNLEELLVFSRYNDSVGWNPDNDTETLEGAVNLLKRSFTPQEVYDAVIEHGQHDKQFKLGDTINYSFQEVVEILRTELMCKAGDM